MLWEEIALRAAQADVPPEFVLREEAQKGILAFLSRRLFFHGGVFQGGTALRLFYANVRYSEDLDFVFTERDHPAFAGFNQTLSALPGFLADLFPFAAAATVKVQKDTTSHKRCTVRLEVPTLRRSLAIRVEAVNIPSYHHELLLLPFPPFNPPVRVESGEEILADKVLAVAFRPFLKGRDIWDIHFLAVQRDFALSPDLVARKVADYGQDARRFREGALRAAQRIAAEGAAVLEREMARFMPGSAFALWRERLAAVARSVARIMAEAVPGEARGAAGGGPPLGEPPGAGGGAG